MKWKLYFLIISILGIQSVFGDTIVTTDKKKYEGKIVKRSEKSYVVRTTDNQMVIVPRNNLWRIYQGEDVIDFKEKMRYKVKVGRPYMPLSILGVAAGIYSVTEFNRYSKNKKKYEAQEEENQADYLGKSNQALATGIASAIISVGSFYIALKPVEMKIPVGRIQVSAASNQVQVSLHF